MNDGPRLRPREHGAYAMLAFPVLSGLILGGGSWAGVAFAVMAVAGFLAHESFVIVLGGRGERLRSQNEIAARGRLIRLGAVIAVGSVVVLATAGRAIWPPLALSAGLTLAVGVLLLLGRTKTLGGEVLVAGAFASIHGVLASAGGAAPLATVLPVVAWAGSFWLATLSVHALKYRFKGRGPGRWTVAAAPGVAAGVLALAGGGLAVGHAWAPVAAALIPKALVVLALSVVTVHPRHLKRVGWSLVAADTATLALLALLIR